MATPGLAFRLPPQYSATPTQLPVNMVTTGPIARLPSEMLTRVFTFLSERQDVSSCRK